MRSGKVPSCLRSKPLSGGESPQPWVLFSPRIFSMALLLLLTAVVTQLCDGQQSPPDTPSRIAVIGAGIGGSAVTYFLHQQFGPQVQIDVYEADRVGGRLATLTVNSQLYECGSPSIHSLNLHMQDFVKLLGLKHRKELAGKSAIFNGENLVLEETDWYLLNLFRLWWHYGISFLRLQMWVEEVMEKFMRVYKYQAHEYAFSTMEGLLRSLGGDHFVNMTQKSVGESLQGIGVSQRFIDDVISAVMKASYGQSVAIPALVGAMSLAGAQGNMWAVEGGNKLVCSGLLKLTKANVIHARVTAVSLHSTEKKHLYEVQYEQEGTLGSDYYDLVIVAAPLHKAGYPISFLNLQPSLPEPMGSYHRVVSSIVHGYLNSSYFGFADPKLFPFSSILSMDTPDAVFHSLESLCPVNVSVGFRRKPPQEAAVWRVLSQRPLDRKELKTLFKSYYSVQVIEWQAFPSYATAGSSKPLPPIILHDGLYYLNGAEWAASSVEMSAVAAKNVALLAFNRWFELNEKIDQQDLMHKLKTEL
ncbi:prenylcysteine oxidase 1-like isoform X2 [Phyllobates terribilis]|uniref:prenylcysteine oxidase 1-like isoform X2 n=2 Tax=Phyllobates terribilis TaxID=111132 RepID=UPI003CCB23A0